MNPNPPDSFVQHATKPSPTTSACSPPYCFRYPTSYRAWHLPQSNHTSPTHSPASSTFPDGHTSHPPKHHLQLSTHAFATASQTHRLPPPYGIKLLISQLRPAELNTSSQRTPPSSHLPLRSTQSKTSSSSRPNTDPTTQANYLKHTQAFEKF